MAGKHVGLCMSAEGVHAYSRQVPIRVERSGVHACGCVAITVSDTGSDPTVIPVCLRGVVRGAVHAVRSCVCLHAQTGLVGKPSVRSEVLGVHGGAV